jgi:hypothetical protein
VGSRHQETTQHRIQDHRTHVYLQYCYLTVRVPAWSLDHFPIPAFASQFKSQIANRKSQLSKNPSFPYLIPNHTYCRNRLSSPNDNLRFSRLVEAQQVQERPKRPVKRQCNFSHCGPSNHEFSETATRLRLGRMISFFSGLHMRLPIPSLFLCSYTEMRSHCRYSILRCPTYEYIIAGNSLKRSWHGSFLQ